MKTTILIIDDDRIFCEAVKDFLSDGEKEIIMAHSGKEGLSVCSARKVDIVLLDQKLPDGEGHKLCASILNHNDQSKIVFVSAYPSFENAVNAVKAGAYDYLTKPFELEELGLVIERTIRTLALERVEQLQSYKSTKEIEAAVLVGNSGILDDVRKLIVLAASVDAPLLITGETGTGKGVVARIIHYSGFNRKAPFISINCAALPENLIEAELFGYEKGAFTGAATSRRGIFEMAEGGTLLLDEIGNMPLHLQTKLLGVLDDKKIRRLGGETIIPLNVRIIATTNLNMEEAIADKRFREDLYYRISVMRILIPPLRERREDIPELCKFFISQSTLERGAKISDSEIETIMDYPWPGNVRELKNVIERSIILHRDVLRPSELLGKMANKKVSSSIRFSEFSNTKEELVSLKEMESDYIRYAFMKLEGNYTRTAKVLGLSINTLRNKLRYSD